MRIIFSAFWLFVMALLIGCGGGSAKPSENNTSVPINLIIDKMQNRSLVEFFAPITIQAKITEKNGKPYHLYIESSDNTFIKASVDQNGLISIASANKSGGIGSSTITLIAFTLSEVANSSFKIDVKTANLPTFSALDFTTVSDTEWDETAVKKVLDTFAYGGHATDIQIKTWADMPPKSAIVQMLTFDATNPLLSPTKNQIPTDISSEKMSKFWNSDDDRNFLSESKRKYYKPTSWGANAMNWALTTLARGTNPFLNKIGMWETNYHMSANRDAGVYPLPMFHHYDNIMNALASNKTYERVLAQGAQNAAIAYQYGHNRNRYSNGIFRGNEDFAREYHQLFFGILGEYDRSYHEETAIPNTARALTDMRAQWHSDSDGGPDTEIIFGTDYHYTADLNILKHTISGANAKDKIEEIAKVDIQAEESLDNLPIMIISHFADDNLGDNTISRIRSSWRAMGEKRLLPFLWAYAVSTDFHSSNRYKYESTIQRNMRIADKMIVDNSDMKELYYDPSYYIGKEGIRAFRPIHDVFGHQTSIEASDNANIFRINYNKSIKSASIYTRYYTCKRDADNHCIKGDDGVYLSTWEKDWAKLISKDDTKNYRVDEVAKWLWQRFISDGLKNYGALERAHIIALLNGKDLALFLNEDKPLTIYSIDDIENNSNIKMLIEDGAVANMKLESSDKNDRRYANRNVGRAIAFIVATPYIYAQEGK